MVLILLISYLHQRVALSTVVNICKKLPSECPSPFMEAVPILCNLLQYEDPQVWTVKVCFYAFCIYFKWPYYSYFVWFSQLVEMVAVCLIKITERVSQSTEMLDELCKHGMIRQVTHFMSLNTRPTLSQPLSNVSNSISCFWDPLPSVFYCLGRCSHCYTLVGRVWWGYLPNFLLVRL